MDSSEVHAESPVEPPLSDGMARTMLRAARRGWEPPSAEELQRSFAQYEIRSVLGRGGMGAVYLGWQKSLDRLVAIKVLPPDVADGAADFAGRFAQEAKAMARFQHPGIVAVYDAGATDDGLLYFVMEYVEGSDLQRLLATHGRLPPVQALRIASAVCDALACAHGHGVVHRDIKPSNIIIEPGGAVKVADFGLAKLSVAGSSLVTASNVALGTPEFIAPEAMSGTGEVDHRADLYAVGVMLYLMLTGELPRGRFIPPSRMVPGLDKRLDRIVDRALQPDRDSRWSSAIELRAALASSAGKSQRKQARWLGAFVVVLLCAGGWWLVPHGQTGTLVVPPGATFAAATRGQPFVNSLGMKFAPVPITGGPDDGQRVLFSTWETRVQDYALFAAQTQRNPPSARFTQAPPHPVVNVSWAEAQAFCAWLTGHERQGGRLAADLRYRLPTDHEWSCAAGLGKLENAALSAAQKAGKLDVLPWGLAWPPPPGSGNYSGEEAAGFEQWRNQTILAAYRDAFPTTAPVGSFPANALGLFDLSGNAWEWCEDLYERPEGTGDHHAMRGGSFFASQREDLVLSRRFGQPVVRDADLGFRVVLSR